VETLSTRAPSSLYMFVVYPLARRCRHATAAAADLPHVSVGPAKGMLPALENESIFLVVLFGHLVSIFGRNP
jgi:hypothetical protein